MKEILDFVITQVILEILLFPNREMKDKDKNGCFLLEPVSR